MRDTGSCLDPEAPLSEHVIDPFGSTNLRGLYISCRTPKHFTPVTGLCYLTYKNPDFLAEPPGAPEQDHQHLPAQGAQAAPHEAEPEPQGWWRSQKQRPGRPGAGRRSGSPQEAVAPEALPAPDQDQLARPAMLPVQPVLPGLLPVGQDH